jgi:hypothetical protein
MFADTSVRLPLGVGTVTPEQVAAGVVKVIRTNKAELDVAPLSLRLGALLGALAPNASTAVQSRLGKGLSAEIISAQRRKR